MKATAITARLSRGMILDVVVFVANLALMSLLADRFLELVRLANEGEDRFARLALFLFALGMLVLPAAGAVLKRWHFHRRGGRGGGDAHFSGCLPIFHFVLTLILSCGVVLYLRGLIFRGDAQDGGAGELLFFFGALVLGVAQTALVYRYFSPPKKAPAGFLRDPRSELLGDLCIFVNMILFQVVWNVFSRIPFGRTADVEEFAGRLFWLAFVAMLIYFPPRIFYLAEDARRPAAWLTMLLANSPTILRALFGVGQNVRG
jgi:hypothetical protein